jgi:hypothetical protein
MTIIAASNGPRGPGDASISRAGQTGYEDATMRDLLNAAVPSLPK